MDVNDLETTASQIAAEIGEPARARMLYCLVDGRARTSTELAAVADVMPSTASAHLQRLKARRLVRVFAQGKHRYYSLDGTEVAAALEALQVLAGARGGRFVPRTPNPLRPARTCYDHVAGALGVAWHDALRRLGWILRTSRGTPGYEITANGADALVALGIDLAATRRLRRRFAYACLDWSERRPHLGGALGAELLRVALERRWLLQDAGSRVLRTTACGRREMHARFGIDFPDARLHDPASHGVAAD